MQMGQRPDADSTGFADCLTKAMLNAATQQLAASSELKERGLSINSVCPGWCRWVSLQLCECLC